ncbi:MAG: ester cyclase [Chloroflexota bacterium]|nr:ester cyclase [Chloroflexota bacterium]
MSRSNKELVCHFLEEVVNRGNTKLLPELVALDHVRHAPDGDLYGPEGMRIELHEWRLGFPDLELAIEDLIEEGDRVVSRFVLRGTHRGVFLATPATGQRVEVVGIGVDRIQQGRLAESWVSFDGLGLLRQLGREMTGR